MTLVFTPRHVDQLVSEIKHEWDRNDPDLQRVADAIPLAQLERAYVKKLDALPPEARPGAAKLNVMRRIYAAWLRAPSDIDLGELIVSAFGMDDNWATLGEGLTFTGDDGLASLIEKRYPPKK